MDFASNKSLIQELQTNFTNLKYKPIPTTSFKETIYNKGAEEEISNIISDILTSQKIPDFSLIPVINDEVFWLSGTAYVVEQLLSPDVYKSILIHLVQLIVETGKIQLFGKINIKKGVMSAFRQNPERVLSDWFAVKSYQIYVHQLNLNIDKSFLDEYSPMPIIEVSGALGEPFIEVSRCTCEQSVKFQYLHDEDPMSSTFEDNPTKLALLYCLYEMYKQGLMRIDPKVANFIEELYGRDA